MSNENSSMEGLYDHKMDPKYRVSIPVKWRPQPGKVLRLISATRRDLPVIQALTEEEFAARLASVDAHPTATPEQKRSLKGRLYTYSRPAEVNPQGKLLVPKEWSEGAGLPMDDYVVLAGRGTFFEIWNTANFARMEERERAELADINKDLGIY